MNFKILDLTCKKAKLYSGLKLILDTVCAENRSLTANEEIQWDSMSAQLAELEVERENRRILDRMLHEHVHQLLKDGK